MNKEEEMNKIRERVAAQNAELAGLEEEIARLAIDNAGPVLLTMMRGLVEMVCAAQGEIFTVHNKLKFYRFTIGMLKQKGIS